MNLEFLNSLEVNTSFEDTLYITACDLKAGNNNSYIVGNLVKKEICIPFKVWSNSPAFEIMKDGKISSGKVCHITGTVKDYNGKYLDVKTCDFIEDAPLDEYLESKYNIEVYEKLFWNILEKNVSEKALGFLKKFLQEDNPEIYERFTKEFAAQKFHDNCLNGLFVHTCKCLTHMANYIKIYPQVYKYRGEEREQDLKDLLFVGVTLHDIGKINEMEYGIYNERSFLTHRLLGAELLFPYKEEISNLYDMEWYDYLVSIIMQHHGPYAEESRTLPAMIIHLIDDFESVSTYLSEQLRGNIEVHACGDTVKYQRPDTIRHVTPYFSVL